ncbi:MAG: hypothetical protein JWQ20_1103 [Conexibacter sp.]|nr:hypothetical protein [Conexibacter sp.]
MSGCGAASKSSQPTGAPTVSLWTSATSADYRQVNDGVRLALAERGGKAGVFRVNFAAREVSDAEPRTTSDALVAARMALQDTQSGAMLTSVGDAPARAAITLLNEAGVPTVSLGDAALKTLTCSSASAFYPNGHATAVVVDPNATLPRAWAARLREVYGIAPTVKAFRAYLGTQAILTALSQHGVTTQDSPAKLNRDALAAELVRGHSGCA